MIRITRLIPATLSLFAIALPLTAPLPAQAAQRDIELLQSYVGEWRGRGTASMDGQDETIVCRLDIKGGNEGKITYNGRCTLAGGTMSINGTMAYVDDANRFEAVMSTNTNFSGVAVGRRRGNGINFKLNERNPNTGSQVAIAAGIELKNEKIAVDFSVSDSGTGGKTTVVVPFEK